MDNNVLNLIRWAEKELERSEIPGAMKEAETLFMHSFKAPREHIYTIEDFKPHSDNIGLFRRYVKLRASRFPLQYIVNSEEFMGLRFALERGVFIPRPETELLVEKALDEIASIGRKRVNILEIGTGCGNIAISLTKQATSCKIIASDISGKALKVADKNARRLGVKRNIKFIKSGYFAKISAIYYNYFDIIISNAPYIRRAEIEHLQPEIGYEDIKALDGGEDGLYSYRRILGDGTGYLKRGGKFIFEIGYDQAEDIKRLIGNDGRFFETKFFTDYNGCKRAVVTKHRWKKG